MGIGQSALAAAQLGIATTGHNIANANTRLQSTNPLAECSRCKMMEEVLSVRIPELVMYARIYNEFIGQQVNATQSSQNYSSSYLNWSNVSITW